jgi:hypothetical protein
MESGTSRPHGDLESLGDLGRGQAQVVGEDKDRPLIRRKPSEAAFEAVAVLDRHRLVRSSRPIDREDADVRVPCPPAARLGVAGVDEQALEPGVEAVRIAEAGQLSPGDHQRLLHSVLGPSDVPEDPLGDRHEPVTVRPGQDGEGLPVTALGLLDDVAIQPIVLPGVHRGRLPTLLSRGRPRAFNLQIRVGTDAVR